jgi:dGTPase
MPSFEDRRQQWQRWLTDRRLGDSQTMPTVGRSPFDRDHDRVVFSDAFRRMADKTQVWPLAEHDHTRTRLTHSLEVSCVGRSLGTMVGRLFAEQGLLPGHLQPADVGTVVATACLAHDIGNPPFGHAGEQSIQRFFAKFFERAGAGFSVGERADLERFEGNAQGFRLLTRLVYRRTGGMRPTAAALGAMVKYPRESRHADALPRHKAYKKFGFFQQDLEQARETFSAFGEPLAVPVLAYARHPLAWLSEAADDICYMIIDLEDAVRLGVVPPERARKALAAFFPGPVRDDDLGALRARVIHELTMATVTAFQDNLEALEAGTFPRALVDATPLAAPYAELSAFSLDHIYQDERVLQVESAGHEAIDGLLGMFVPAILDPGWSRDAYHARLVNLLPVEAFRVVFPSEPPGDNPIRARALLMDSLTPYQRLLVVTDHVSGLTDSAAVDLYQKLKGVKLPR